jgi:hypothetical protein
MKKTFLILSLLCMSLSARAALTTGTDEQAQLPYWQWQDEVVSIRFVQRLPDQTRAYFAGRGFQGDDVKLIAEHCIFQTVFKNIATPQSKTSLEYDVDKWYAVVDGKKIGLKMREAWQAIWEARKAGPAQKIAFEWSLLPTRQRYLPSDYNWGMSVFPIAHGATFDLMLSWRINGKSTAATIKGMQCAKDIYIAPTGE